MSSRPSLNHVGVISRDIEALATFYRDVVGMLETDRGRSGAGRDVIFLSADPRHHHQLVLASGRGADQPSTIGQLSFLLEDLDGLRGVVARLAQKGMTPARVIDHGASWSVYVMDPEENTLEFYVISPWYIPQPYAEPLDLNLSDGDVRARTAERCRLEAGYMLMEEWRANMQARLTSSWGMG